MRRCFWLLLLLAMWSAAWPDAVQADELRPGYLELAEQSEGIWRVAWKQPVTAAPAERPLPPVIPDICVFAQEPEIGFAAGAIMGSGTMKCSGTLGGHMIGMPNLLGQSDVLVRVQPLFSATQALRLTAREPSVQIAARPDTWQVLRTYFVIGVEHILGGWDHLLFVIALVLLVQKWKAVIAAATAFTLSHSITLIAAVLGYLGLPGRPVEALIALSIVFLAVEVLRNRGGGATLTKRLPWVVAFLFGLLHGFGFAGALSAIGLPESDIAAALLAFNLGVEAGQLMVVTAVLVVMALVRKVAMTMFDPAIRLAAYAIGITGSYWLIERVVA